MRMRPHTLAVLAQPELLPCLEAILKTMFFRSPALPHSGQGTYFEIKRDASCGREASSEEVDEGVVLSTAVQGTGVRHAVVTVHAVRAHRSSKTDISEHAIRLLGKLSTLKVFTPRRQPTGQRRR
jgi:hypothetical protein